MSNICIYKLPNGKVVGEDGAKKFVDILSSDLEILKKNQILYDTIILNKENLIEERKQKLKEVQENLILKSSNRLEPDVATVDIYPDGVTSITEYLYNSGYIKGIDLTEFKTNRALEIENELNSNNISRTLAEKVEEATQAGIPNNKLIEAIVNNEINSWQYIRKIGTQLDNIMGIIMNPKNQYKHYFENGVFLIDKFKEDRGSLYDDPSMKSYIYDLEGLTDNQVQQFAQDALRLKKQLNIKQGDKVITQAVLNTLPKFQNLRGKADLLIIRKNGDIDVYDYKVSSKSMGNIDTDTEWDYEKVKDVKTQMSLYKRILESYGIPSTKIKTHIINIKLDGVSSTTDTGDIALFNPVSGWDNPTIKNKVSAININTPVEIELDASNSSDIVIYQFIDNLVNFKPEFSGTAKDIQEKIAKQFYTLFPNGRIENTLSIIGKEFVMEKYIKKLPNGKYSFNQYYLTKLGNESLEYETASEAASAFLEKFGNSLEHNKSGYTHIFKSLQNQLTAFNNAEERQKDRRTFSNTLFSQKYGIDFQLEFKKYFAEEGWEVYNAAEQSINDMLAEMGIILLYNENNGTPKFDIISITSGLDLDRVIKFKYNDSIFGNVSTEVSGEKATFANILKYRAMLVVNELLKDNNAKLDEIKITNTDIRRNTVVYRYDGADTIDNFKQLMTKAGETSYISSNKVLSFEEKIFSTFDQILGIVDLYPTLDKTDVSRIVDITASLKKELPSDIRQKEIIALTLQDLYYKIIKLNNMQQMSVDNIITTNTFECHILRQIAILLSKYGNMLPNITDINRRGDYGIGLSKNDPYSLKNALKNKTFLSGNLLTTNDQNPIMSGIYNVTQEAFQVIRDRYTKYKDKHNKEYFRKGNKFGGSNLSSFDYNKYFDNTPENKNRFLFKNPETDTTLSSEEKEFLTWYLDTLNSYRFFNGKDINSVSEETVYNLKENGTWYEVPLMRTSLNSQVSNSSIKEMIKLQANKLLDPIKNLRGEIDSEVTEMGIENFKDVVDMYDIFEMSPERRKELLNQELSPATLFNTQMEVILDNFVQAKIVKWELDNVLPSVSAALLAMEFSSKMMGKDLSNEIEFVIKNIKSGIFKESLLRKDSSIIKTVQVLRKITSKSIMSFNIMSGARELVNGIYYYHSKAIANKYDDTKPSFMNVMDAYNTVWIDSFKQFAVQSKLEKMNFKFGMTQLDIDQMAEAQNYWKDDFLRFNNYAQWASRAPDFLHRMTILVSYMKKYGVYDAYTVDELNDELVYDWRKDSRFSALASGSKVVPEEYKKQLAIYKSQMDDFVKEGKKVFDKHTQSFRPLKWDGNFDNPENDALPEAFTTQEINSYRQEANIAFGYMDNSVKSLVFKEGVLSILLQFQTYLSGKVAMWFQTPGIYKQGRKVFKTDSDGKQLYRKPNETGTDYEEVTDSRILSNGEWVELEPIYTWEGSVSEGLMWSFVDCFNILNRKDMQKAWANPVKKGQALMALTHILTWLFVMTGLSLYGGNSKIRKHDNLFVRNSLLLMYNTVSDLNIITQLWGVAQFNYTSLNYTKKLAESFWKAATKENYPAIRVLTNFGFTAPFRKELYDVTVTLKN